MNPFCLSVHICRRIEIRSLDQQIAAFRPDRHHFACFKPFFEKMVEHMLGGQMQHHIAFVGGLNLLENFTQLFGGVGNILHYVRSHPDGPYALYLVYRQQAEAFVKCLHTVIHSGEEVAVPISITLQDS